MKALRPLPTLPYIALHLSDLSVGGRIQRDRRTLHTDVLLTQR